MSPSKSASTLDNTVTPASAVAKNAVAPNGDRTAAPTRGWWKAFNHLLRRIHLYAGLLLLPWVFLYGVTGLLFNHHDLFPDTKTLRFERADMEGTSLAEAPTAADLAKQVVALINTRQESKFQLVAPELARFDRGGLSANVVDGNGAAYTVVLDAKGNGGTIRESRERAASDSPAPFAARRGVELQTSPTAVVEKGLPGVLEKVGLANPQVTEVRMAPLAFQMEENGQRWQVSYNSQSGSLSGQPVVAGSTPPLSARSFLLRLHTAHHYPAEYNVRWVWAVIVDAISIVMVFWGLSGIVMWLQIKRTRLLGAAFLLASVVAATWIGYGMYASILASPTGR